MLFVCPNNAEDIFSSMKYVLMLDTYFTVSDLLSAITATFEEKIRSLQESPLGLVASEGASCPTQDPVLNPSQDPLPHSEPPHHPRGNSSSCRLYRDPSLHRRRTNPRTSTGAIADLQARRLVFCHFGHSLDFTVPENVKDMLRTRCKSNIKKLYNLILDSIRFA